ncbi:hypothetical protein [Paenibacillus polymyxa]|uniref:hypothetical protein n=1 Tax=Paenibacillus polymyxa TaxID=1406 RepID=UPI002023C96A|nr:hypothetical protein [Paenibacillus polymyxa]URJ51934.3 hypothetical protein MF626_001399 [Paenibacillus polymyxa]
MTVKSGDLIIALDGALMEISSSEQFGLSGWAVSARLYGMFSEEDSNEIVLRKKTGASQRAKHFESFSCLTHTILNRLM